MRRSIPAKSCAAPSNSARRRSSWSTITPRAIRRRRPTDIQMTKQIVALGKSLNVAVHDHLIIGRQASPASRACSLFDLKLGAGAMELWSA